MMQVGPYTLGLDKPLLIMAGPCVVESEALALETAGILKEITTELELPFVYKSSFVKANRSSHLSFSGLGFEKALGILAKVKKEIGVMIVTDVHEDTPLDEVCEVADVLQTPAFLCRQTRFIQSVVATGLPVNIKKGQFLAPWDMKHVVAKAQAVKNHNTIMVCERGVSFGYNNLVSDMRSLAIMRESNVPVIFDATHSVQLPGGQGTSSGGQREFVATLAKAAVAVGVHGLFMETHPDPDKALSDGPNAWPLAKMKALLYALKSIDTLVKQNHWVEL